MLYQAQEQLIATVNAQPLASTVTCLGDDFKSQILQSLLSKDSAVISEYKLKFFLSPS